VLLWMSKKEIAFGRRPVFRCSTLPPKQHG
jgi:hypothetical protein